MGQQSTVTTILNGFGLSLGDGIIGLQALSAARALGLIEGRVVLGRREPPEKPLVPQLYGLIGDLAEVMPFEDAPRGGRLIDIRDFAFDPRFACVSMIDFFLARLDIPPDVVPASLKRNRWLAERKPVLPALPLPAGYVLLCPRASIALRDMPEEIETAILMGLAARGIGPVVTQGRALMGAVAAPRLSRIEELCSLVAGARAIISTDTAILHLADAFDVPSLGFFTTHRPAWRVRDYPRCMALHLPATGLPESIEFIRSEDDLRAARAAWFPAGADLGWLARALDQFGDFAGLPGA